MLKQSMCAACHQMYPSTCWMLLSWCKLSRLSCCLHHATCRVVHNAACEDVDPYPASLSGGARVSPAHMGRPLLLTTFAGGSVTDAVERSSSQDASTSADLQALRTCAMSGLLCKSGAMAAASPFWPVCSASGERNRTLPPPDVTSFSSTVC